MTGRHTPQAVLRTPHEPNPRKPQNLNLWKTRGDIEEGGQQQDVEDLRSTILCKGVSVDSSSDPAERETSITSHKSGCNTSQEVPWLLCGANWGASDCGL